MLSHIHPKYTLSVQPKDGARYNPVHNDVQGTVATVIDVEPGQRGWIAYYADYDERWHRLHTSIVQELYVDASGNIVITTENTFYSLHRL